MDASTPWFGTPLRWAYNMIMDILDGTVVIQLCLRGAGRLTAYLYFEHLEEMVAAWHIT